MAEINNLMAYSLGIGDALFMVVNILGKALRASRCLFVCTDDKTADWKCYEFWQQDKVKSCQEYHWPTNDSSLIAQTLRARSPLRLYEGQENSYLTPAQAELQFSGTRSLLAMPLYYENNVYGCVIIHQCDYRRDWTREEVDMVQHAADRVAKALANLPEEKRIHKPIMRLHQRIVSAEEAPASPTGTALIQSLKGAFGQKSIPNATETAHELPAVDPSAVNISVKAPEATATETAAKHSTESPGLSASFETSAVKPAKRSATANKLGTIKKKTGTKESLPSITEEIASAPNIVPVKAKDKTSQSSGTFEPAWGNLDEIPTPAAGPAMSGLGISMLPKVKAQPAATGSSLRASLHKDKSGTENAIDAIAPEQLPPSSSTIDNTAAPTDATVASSPTPAESEEEAKEKVEKALAANEQGNRVSDYIFAIPGVDPRTLGRIVGWIEEIEKKDKYMTPHAINVAEYACAIATKLNLSPREIADIKIAALLHDVGKLGTSAEVLQKRDDDLADAELLTIMRHPMDGAELLQSFPELSSFSSIILAHHEEYGGNGYPQGLKGEEIPLAARIIFIANSYHSMVSDLRYRKGMSAKEAQKHLQEEAGNQCDPALVAAFLKYLQEKAKH